MLGGRCRLAGRARASRRRPGHAAPGARRHLRRLAAPSPGLDSRLAAAALAGAAGLVPIQQLPNNRGQRLLRRRVFRLSGGRGPQAGHRALRLGLVGRPARRHRHRGPQHRRVAPDGRGRPLWLRLLPLQRGGAGHLGRCDGICSQLHRAWQVWRGLSLPPHHRDARRGGIIRSAAWPRRGRVCLATATCGCRRLRLPLRPQRRHACGKRRRRPASRQRRRRWRGRCRRVVRCRRGRAGAPRHPVVGRRHARVWVQGPHHESWWADGEWRGPHARVAHGPGAPVHQRLLGRERLAAAAGRLAPRGPLAPSIGTLQPLCGRLIVPHRVALPNRATSCPKLGSCSGGHQTILDHML